MARDLDKLQQEIEELFADLWHLPRGRGGGFRPNVDSFHTDDPHELTVVIELPGVDPESLELAVGERMLTISGERRRPKIEGCAISYQQMEIAYGPFKREVRLPENVDPEGARAHYEHGIVTISMPVSEKAPPRGRVSITVEGK